MNLIFLTRLFHPHQGGVEKHVFNLSKHLIDQHCDITVITEQFDPQMPLEETWQRIHIVRIPYTDLHSKFKLWHWMLQHEPLFKQADIIHIHDVYWWYWPLRFKLSKLPTYITFHGYEGSNPPTWKAIVQRKAAEKAARASVCIGDFMRTWYFAHPTFVSYGAAEMPTPRIRGIELVKKLMPMMGGVLTGTVGVAKINTENWDQPTDPNQAVFWGRFDYDTGIDLYLDAVNQLNLRRKQDNKSLFKLNIYGDGPLKNQIIVSNSVKLYPWDNDISSILGSARYAFVSRYLSILEAMQSKRLVVAVYNNAIKRDYLTCHPMHDTMVIAGNTQELIAKLEKLTPDQENLMIQTAYTWAKAQTWEKLVEQYKTIWKI